MSVEELLAENNRLMQKLLDLEAENRKEAEESKADFDARMKEIKVKGDEKVKAHLVDLGAPEDAAEGSDDDWEKRMNAAQQKSREQIEVMRERDQAYKETLLKEMAEQTDLLRKISEKLG